jgi:leucyl-tRNA synthetase
LCFTGGEGTSIAADACLEVFTTRPDTIFGATYMVIAPEHPLLESLASSSQRDPVQEYVAKAALKSDLERTELQKVKTGVDTGSLPGSLRSSQG